MEPFSIGIDLGGTSLRVAAFLAEGRTEESIRLPTRVQDGPEAVIADLCSATETLLDRYGIGRECLGIGIGTPGPLELPAGILRNPPNLPGFDGLNLRSALESRLAPPIFIDSDANVAALAEEVLGSGRNLPVPHGAGSLCMLTLGTGVGNGIILNGKVWQGMNGMGGEAGHVAIWPDGAQCGCGNRGCLEMYASATAVARMARESGLSAENSGGASPTARGVAELAERGDPAALAIMNTVGSALGISLAGLVNTLNLPLYVVGGGVANAWHLFAPAMFAELEARSYVYRMTKPARLGTFAPGTTEVVRAQLGDEAGLLGAGLLPRASS